MKDTGFDELRDLCHSVGDQLSLGFGMAGLMTVLILDHRFREAARVASDCSRLLETMADQSLTLMLYAAASNPKVQAGEVAEGLRLARRSIALADGDPTRDNAVVGSPLALALTLRGGSLLALGMRGWRDDLDRAAVIAKSIDPTSHIATVMFKYVVAIDSGALLPDNAALAETAEALDSAERGGDEFSLDSARLARGLVLVHSGGVHRSAGLALLNQYRDACVGHGYTTNSVRWVDVENAKEKARVGELDGAIDVARVAVEFLYETGDMLSRGSAVAALVELLIRRGGERDLAEASAAMDRLAAVPTDPGFVLHELPLLRMRALLAHAHGDGAAYEEFRDRYRAMANDLGLEGHIAAAEAMH